MTLDEKDIRWRVSNTWEKGGVKWGMLVGYIDARTCMEALDAMDPQWSAVHGDPIVVGNELMGVPCALTVNGITRSDVGMPSSQDPIKGAYSDALKRAAIHHNVGRELYELPKIAVECELKPNGQVKAPKALPAFKNGRWTIDSKVGWVRYDREPDDEQSAREARPPKPSAEPDLRAELAQVAAERSLDLNGIGQYADLLGFPKGERLNDDQMHQLIEAVRGHGTDATLELPTTDPPEVGTDEYKALDAKDKAAARAYWADEKRKAAAA